MPWAGWRELLRQVAEDSDLTHGGQGCITRQGCASRNARRSLDSYQLRRVMPRARQCLPAAAAEKSHQSPHGHVSTKYILSIVAGLSLLYPRTDAIKRDG